MSGYTLYLICYQKTHKRTKYNNRTEQNTIIKDDSSETFSEIYTKTDFELECHLQGDYFLYSSVLWTYNCTIYELSSKCF